MVYLKKWIIALSLYSSATAFALNQNEILKFINQSTKPTMQRVRHVDDQSAFNWSSLHGPQTGGAMRVVALKNNSAVLFAFHPYVNNSLYKSVDGGQHWEVVYASKNECINDIVTIDENHLLMAADNHVYVSVDQGMHWTLTAAKGNICNKLFVSNPKLIFLITNRQYDHPGFYRSIDGGYSWEPATLGLGDDWWYTAVGGKDNYQFVVGDGLYVSTNEGKLWSQPNKNWSKKEEIESIAISSQYDIYVAGYPGIFKTDPQGQSWSNIHNGIKGEVRRVVIDKDDRLYALTSDTLYSSIDKGQTWQRAYTSAIIHSMTILDNNHLILSTDEGLLEMDEHQQNPNKLPLNFSVSNTKKVLAIDDNHFYAVDKDLYRSDDAGATWSLSRQGSITDAVVFNQKIVEMEWGKNGSTLSTSDDNGLTWKQVYGDTNQSCRSLSAQNGALVVSCEKQALITRDLITWNVINNAHDQYNNPYYFDGKFIYYANGKLIKRSADDGKSWTTLLDGLNQYRAIVAGYQDTVLIAIESGGIIKVTNDGKDWDLINYGIYDYHFSDIIAIDDKHYVVSTNDGVFYTRDGGKHWMAENIGLDNLDVSSIFANQKFILAGTNGGGVYLSSIK